MACTMIDNSKEVLRRIEWLFTSKKMSDITLVVGNQVLQAHCLILSASSIVFETMFSTTWNEERNVVNLVESTECENVFERFLKYIYTGRIELCVRTVLPVLQLADKYDVKELMTVCIEYMRMHIPNALVNGVLISWLQCQTASSIHELNEDCMNFVLHNIEGLDTCEDLGQLEVETMLYILQQNDLVVESELFLFYVVLKWLRLRLNNLMTVYMNPESTDCQEEMQLKEDSLVKYVMGHIRFPMMTLTQLASLHQLDIVNRHKDFFMPRLGLGMVYQRGQMIDAVRVVQTITGDSGNVLFTPRLYSSNTYSYLLELLTRPIPREFSSHTYCFSSRRILANDSSTKEKSSCDWSIDVFPCGVCFDKCFVIVSQGMLECPQQVKLIFRARLTCHGKAFPHRVMVGVCLYKAIDKVEYVYSLQQYALTFDTNNTAKNFDDIISCEELSIIGRESDTLRLKFIIVPLDKYCQKFWIDRNKSKK